MNKFNKHVPFNVPNGLTKKISRRHMLKSAAGAAAISMTPSFAFDDSDVTHFEQALKTKPWNTLDAVMEHLLPVSNSGVSAKDINATFYLHQLVFQQPTSTDEIEFIYKGVGWLNGFTQSKLSRDFIELTSAEKETMLRAISQSEAGKNWLNMMILNIYEAMLSPPAYGGNTNGIGWKWLKHQAGFPLPKAGQRYFELPPRSSVNTSAAQVDDGNFSNQRKIDVTTVESRDLLANQWQRTNKGNS